jgi:hypothetical protein
LEKGQNMTFHEEKRRRDALLAYDRYKMTLLRGGGSTHNGLDDGEFIPVVQDLTVTPEDVLKRFLASHPEHGEFETDLAKTNLRQRTVFVNQALWNSNSAR